MKRPFFGLTAVLSAAAVSVLIAAGKPPAAKQVIVTKGAVPAVVPDGKVWKVGGLAPYNSDSGVGTADLTIDGQMLVGENNGLTLAGKFDVSVNSSKHPSIQILAGSKVSVGDSRNKVVFREEGQ